MKIAILDNNDDFVFDESFKINEINYYIVNHAAICASMITTRLSNKQDVEIVAKKVLDRHNLTGDFSRLKKALVWCKKNNVKLVNLSLGSKDPRDFMRINNLCKELAEEGMIIVASLSNDMNFTLPACSEYAIGVGIDNNFYGDYYWSEKYDCLLLSGKNVSTIKKEGNQIIEIPKYNSFAAPQIVAEIANFMSYLPNASLQSIKEKYGYKQKCHIDDVAWKHNNVKPIVLVKEDVQTARMIAKHFMKKGYNVLVKKNTSIQESEFVQKMDSFPYDIALIISEDSVDCETFKPDITVDKYQITTNWYNENTCKKRLFKRQRMFKVLDNLLIEVTK